MNYDTFKDSTLSDIAYNESSNYLYSLICDYEKFILQYGAIALKDYIPTWTCIPKNVFWKLEENDIFYDCCGNQYIVIDAPFESEDENDYYIECVMIHPDGTRDKTSQMFQTGDVYSEPVVNTKQNFMKLKPKGEDKICPVLITSQVPLQS